MYPPRVRHRVHPIIRQLRPKNEQRTGKETQLTHLSSFTWCGARARCHFFLLFNISSLLPHPLSLPIFIFRFLHFHFHSPWSKSRTTTATMATQSLPPQLQSTLLQSDLDHQTQTPVGIPSVRTTRHHHTDLVEAQTHLPAPMDQDRHPASARPVLWQLAMMSIPSATFTPDA